MRKIFAVLFLLGTISLGKSQQTVGLFTLEEGAVDGYNLLAPFSSDSIYLLDNCGRIVHSWLSDYELGASAYLLENGNLLRQSSVRNSPFGSGATCGVIELLDWEGNQLWEFDLSSTSTCFHHDLEILPNGNVLVIAYEAKTEAEAIAAGRDLSRISVEGLWEDKILEIEQTGPTTGNVVWEWHAWDHLVQEYDSSKNNYGLIYNHPELIDVNFPVSPFTSNPAEPDWMHSNSVAYNPELDQIMVSSRHSSEIWIIDHSTNTTEAASHSGGLSGRGGDLLFRWGNPQVYHHGTASDQEFHGQHNARWIEAGHPWENKIMVFNNGDFNRLYSSVEVLQPPVNSQGQYQYNSGQPYGPLQPDWEYSGGADDGWYSPFISGAQPLDNGHILICDGPVGRVFEIDSTGNIYWEYVSPVTSLGPQPQGTPIFQNYLFRMERYPVDYPGLAGRDLTPGNRVEPLALSLPTSCLPDTTDGGVIDLIIYPNPFDQVFRVLVPEEEEVKMQVFDVLGRSKTGLLSIEHEQLVPTSDWLPGIYILQFEGSIEKRIKVLKVR